MESKLSQFFETVDLNARGSVTYSKLMMDSAFPRDSWQADALKDFLKNLADKGLKVIWVNKNENVRLASRVIILVCVRLAELHALHYDAEKSILTFCVKASNQDFVKFVERKRQAQLNLEVD